MAQPISITSIWQMCHPSSDHIDIAPNSTGINLFCFYLDFMLNPMRDEFLLTSAGTNQGMHQSLVGNYATALDTSD